MANSHSTHTQTLLQLSGYTLLEEIYRGTRTIVYRAMQTETQRPVVIKVLHQDYPSFSELVQFRNQYTVTKNLPIAGIVQPLSLESLGNSYALVMEDLGSISLGQYLQQQPLSLTETLAIAIQLADILHHLHQHRVIHKDIKPANILIHPDSKQVQLIDFSIASLLPKETQAIQSPNVLEGTIAYLAPEQTGRMNRGIDYRADFYALGITLYQLLTRKLPFVSEDPLELIHCHIAQVAMSANQVNPDVPSMVAAIVAKLMAKNAEDRYQSAIGFKYDLEQCLSQYKETGAVSEFTLGQRDLSDRFIIPEKLYGRETEVQILLDAFERVAVGTTELMLVAGFSGIGKTAVVNEVHKPIVRQHGYFIKGKFDQFNRNIPLSAFVQAFRDLVGQLLSESDAQLQTWKTLILEALGDNGQVIIELIPELERIIGTQPSVPELSGTAAQNRFNLLFQKFIAVFTTAEHPLVIFLDDLQWADSASLQFVKLLMNDNGYLLMLGAYRDNEVSSVHPFMLTIEELKKVGAIVHTITLKPLAFEDTNRLVADTLNCSTQLAQPLTELIDRKTQGNPFFTTQFLKALHEDGHLCFDADHRYWQCDIAQIHALALTDDVVEFMALQLQKLPQETQQALKLAACMGNQFDLETLAIISEQSSTDAATALWKALQEGLIIPTSQAYKFFQDADEISTQDDINPIYRFLHDRVQQAASLLITEAHRQQTYFQIGQLLLNNTPADQLELRIFDIVNHLNMGIELISDQSQKCELAQLNLIAGRKAKKSYAHTTAVKHFTLGINLLLTDDWQANYELTFDLYRERGECEYLIGNFEVSKQLLDTAASQYAISDIDKAEICSIVMNLYMTQGADFATGIKAGLEGLKILGLSIPRQNEELKQMLVADRQQVQHLLSGLEIADLYDSPIHIERTQNLIIRLLIDLWALSYLEANGALLQLTVLKIVLSSLQHGNTSLSAFGYVTYAMNLAIEQDYSTAYQLAELALKLNEKFNRTDLMGKVNNLFCHAINPYNRPLFTNLAFYQESYYRCMECGDLTYGVWALFFNIWTRLEIGEDLQEVEKEAEKYLNSVEKVGDLNMLSSFQALQRAILSLRGRHEYRVSFNDEIFNEHICVTRWRENNFDHGLNWFYYLKAQLLYTYEQYEAALQTFQTVEDKVAANVGFFPVTKYYFYYLLALTAIYPQVSDHYQETYWQIIDRHQKQIKTWEKSCPENFLHQSLLVSAEIARIQGQRSEAIDFYEQAIIAAKANHFIHHEALANELAAKFYLNWGKEKVAAGYMQEAYYCYAQWGAKAKIADLETRYPHLLRPILQPAEASISILSTLATISAYPVSGYTSKSKSSSSHNINQALDFAAILKASQALSSTIQLDQLLHQLTHIILQTSGADRCALILPSDTKQWQVRAIATPQETQLCTEPLTNNPHVPVKLIQYVKNTQEVVVIDNMETTLPVIGDYLRERQPKSVLCLPLLHQGHLVGILYLKNQLTPGVFTEERILILNFLCTQAAISLENARLYQHLEYSLQDAQQKSQDLAEVLALSNGQQQILALIAQGVSLNTILAATARFIESHTHHRAYCSFSLIDAEGRLRYAAAPSLPAAYNALIDGVKIGPEVGSCGTAAYCKASVTVTDIATDPLWANYQVALDFGLRACTSTPILGAEGQVLATLAMYQPVAGEFTLYDRKLMEVATYLARIAIERHQADIELQNTQLQIVQSEKMASLGNLVAGVAHEINNPIGFLNGSINNGQDYVQDLLGHLALYQQHYPNPVEAIQDNAEDIDLEFLTQDLPKLLESMQGATDRIKDISTSLRTFSRADTEYKVSANLHDGLNSTLLILKYRLKANEFRPAIQVIQNYGNLPAIECFPGQLNQVFMNILANAIDMFDEMAQSQSLEAIKANPQQITIHTQQVGEQVKISIRDNGKGMSQQVQAKIFDHLFTTKSVGKGTGLGLAIARQIVVEKHGGRLEVHSQLGKGSEFCIYLPI